MNASVISQLAKQLIIDLTISHSSTSPDNFLTQCFSSNFCELVNISVRPYLEINSRELRRKIIPSEYAEKLMEMKKEKSKESYSSQNNIDETF